MSSYTNVILPLVTAESNDPLILWLKNHKLLSSSMDCEHCSKPMSWTKNSKLGDGYNWRCINRKCTQKKGATTAIRKGSIFENSRLSLKMVNLFIILRQVCSQFLQAHPIELGGPGAVLQIDESCLSHKQKYHCGRVAQNQIWVFGIVDTSYTPSRGLNITRSITQSVL